MEENKLTNENIKNLIYTIRGKQVMLDSDVAMLYQYSTKRINEAVRRNIARFPERFCFQLTEKEVENIMKKTSVMIAKDNWSQIATSSKSENSKHRGKKYLPYAFTEQGIAMLSGLLKNEIAIQVSINIMDAFVEMRKFLMAIYYFSYWNMIKSLKWFSIISSQMILLNKDFFSRGKFMMPII